MFEVQGSKVLGSGVIGSKVQRFRVQPRPWPPQATILIEGETYLSIRTLFKGVVGAVFNRNIFSRVKFCNRG